MVQPTIEMIWKFFKPENSYHVIQQFCSYVYAQEDWKHMCTQKLVYETHDPLLDTIYSFSPRSTGMMRMEKRNSSNSSYDNPTLSSPYHLTIMTHILRSWSLWNQDFSHLLTFLVPNISLLYKFCVHAGSLTQLLLSISNTLAGYNP